jgi:uncharacterized protein
MIDKELIRVIRKQFVLEWDGIHGASHWARVRENGLRLAEHTAANPAVVELFAFLHDSQRIRDGYDPDHGLRAAQFARVLCGSVFYLSAPELELLMEACKGHSDGLTEGDITVLTCWDADRLDLGRIGVPPDPRRLCTNAARDPAVIEWAMKRSLAGYNY